MKNNFEKIYISNDLWQLNELSLFKKIILGAVESLDKGNGCSLTNKELADIFRMSTKHVSAVVNELIKEGFLISNTKNFEKRTLKICREAVLKSIGYRVNPKFIETKSERVQLLLQPSVAEDVKLIAKQKGLSLNEAINKAIQNYII